MTAVFRTPPIEPTPDGMVFLCHLDDLTDGESKGFDPEGSGRDTMFIVRKGARLFAWRNACPHQRGARMGWKKDAFLNGDKSRIMCFAHGALFDIQTGLCDIGPCIGKHLSPVHISQKSGRVFCAVAK